MHLSPTSKLGYLSFKLTCLFLNTSITTCLLMVTRRYVDEVPGVNGP